MSRPEHDDCPSGATAHVRSLHEKTKSRPRINLPGSGIAGGKGGEGRPNWHRSVARLASRILIPLSLLYGGGGGSLVPQVVAQPPLQGGPPPAAAPTNTIPSLSPTPSGNVKTPIPLLVTNNCPEAIWPGVGTQNGIGPGIGGFELVVGESAQMYVSSDWQGRVWGRTNCSFNADGNGPSNLNGVNGNGAACMTGDCFGRLDCEFTGQVPTTLAEFNLIGGMEGKQTFYDISLVDGYNLPMAIVYIPAKNTTWIPPNLTNCACIASAGFLAPPGRSGITYTNASYPVPYEPEQTNMGVANWCPWDLQEYPPSKPGDGVYPYPDDNIQRPVFDPCLSACSSTNDPQDCCTGEYNDPNVCRPSLYSENAKAVCPDAYSYAFDDQTSTFIIPTGGGWEVVFCPAGRSTNILQVFGPQLRALASGGRVTREMMDVITNKTFIEMGGSATSGAAPGAVLFSGGWVYLMAVMVGTTLLVANR